MNYLDISGISFDPDSDIFVSPEKGIYGLYSCQNIKGICLVKDRSR
jgi:hypothetical protein